MSTDTLVQETIPTNIVLQKTQGMANAIQDLPNDGGSPFVKITWTSHGGIGTAETSLTGSSHEIVATRANDEIVRFGLDSGMFQGKGSERNPTLPISPDQIDQVLLSH